MGGEKEDGLGALVGFEVEDRGDARLETLDDLCMAGVVEQGHGPATVADCYHGSAHLWSVRVVRELVFLERSCQGSR